MVLVLQSTYLICTTWKCKQTMYQQPHRACEQTTSKGKQNHMPHSNWPRVLMFDLAHKQCNGIIKGWLHCLMSEPKGRFLVTSTLMFGSAWCLVMAQIQFSSIKQNKNWTSRTLANPPALIRLITSQFCLTPCALGLVEIFWLLETFH